MITVGGWGAGARRWPLPPSSSTSSPWTTFTTCWAGVSDRRTSWPTALARARSTNVRAALKLAARSRSATPPPRRGAPRPVAEQRADLADLPVRARQERLAAEAGVDRHHEHEVEVVEHVLERVGGRRGVEGDARARAGRAGLGGR